jgi:hypothetical protein
MATTRKLTMNTLTKLKDGRLRAGLSAAALLVAFALAGCGKSGTKDEHAGEGDKQAAHAGEKKEGHSEAESELTLTTEEAARAGIKVEEVKPQGLGETLTVTATIRPDADRLAHVARTHRRPHHCGPGKAGRQSARRPDAGHAGQRGRWRSARSLDPSPGRTGHRRRRLQAR